MLGQEHVKRPVNFPPPGPENFLQLPQFGILEQPMTWLIPHPFPQLLMKAGMSGDHSAPAGSDHLEQRGLLGVFPPVWQSRSLGDGVLLGKQVLHFHVVVNGQLRQGLLPGPFLFDVHPFHSLPS